MNDTELDRLLDTWEAPAPPPSLRQGLRARFPRIERPRFRRPLGWALVIAVATITLATGIPQSGENVWGSRLVGAINSVYEDFLDGIEV